MLKWALNLLINTSPRLNLAILENDNYKKKSLFLCALSSYLSQTKSSLCNYK